MYFTDRGIEELAERRGGDEVSLSWLADRLQVFVDAHPDFEVAIDRLATWLARADDDEDGPPLIVPSGRTENSGKKICASGPMASA